MSDRPPEDPPGLPPPLYDPQAQLEEALSFMSHDAREGHASTLALLELQRVRADPMALGELVERVERNARRSLALIDDFMDIARARTRPLRNAELDLVDELLDVVANAWLTANARGVQVRVAPGPETAPALGDRELLSAALSKLVRDASAKAPRGGEIVCALRGEAAFWVIEVQEAMSGEGDGPVGGADTAALRRSNRPRRVAAAEPGLTLARIAASRHGGHVQTEQVPGQPRKLRMHVPRANDTSAFE